MENIYLEDGENYDDFDEHINPTLLAVAIAAASEIATEFSLLDIIDIGDGPDYARTLADTFLSYLENGRTHIQEHENYDDFREHLADALLADASNVLSQALDPSHIQEDSEWFAKNAAITIESQMNEFDISLNAEDTDD